MLIGLEQTNWKTMEVKTGVVRQSGVMVAGLQLHLKREPLHNRSYIHPNVRGATIHNGQDMEATQVSTDRGVG